MRKHVNQIHPFFACVLFGLILQTNAFAQINKDELALKISKAEEDNLQKLKAYLWNRNSDIYINDQLKGTVETSFGFDQSGKLQADIIDAQTNVKQKRGIRGKVQKNAAEDKMEYAAKTLELSLQYTYMSKGQLIDFFTKATFSKNQDGILIATADNVYVQGDRLTVHIDPKTNLFIYKEFKSLLGKDPVDGKVTYEKFSSGVSHQSTMTLNMPAQKMRTEAKNQDYSQRVN